MNNETIPARTVAALLAELLAALDAGDDQARLAGAGHVVHALRRLTTGPAITTGDVGAVTTILHSHLAETSQGAAAGPPEPDPEDGPFSSREEAQRVFEGFARAAAGEAKVRHLAEALIDTVDSNPGAVMGDYDRQLAAWLGELLGPVDVAVICSWIRRAAGDLPDTRVHIVRPDLEVGE